VVTCLKPINHGVQSTVNSLRCHQATEMESGRDEEEGTGKILDPCRFYKYATAAADGQFDLVVSSLDPRSLMSALNITPGQCRGGYRGWVRWVRTSFIWG
jgi:hypothetical protein